MTNVNHTNLAPNPLGPVADVSLIQAALTVTNIAAALTDASAACRQYQDLRPFNFVRLGGNVTTQAANGGQVRLQYSTDGGSTFAYFDTTNSGPAVSLIGTGVKTSGWVAVPAAAQRENAILRLITISGDGAEDPVVSALHAEFSA